LSSSKSPKTISGIVVHFIKEPGYHSNKVIRTNLPRMSCV
jgi:hypothetical protein